MDGNSIFQNYQKERKVIQLFRRQRLRGLLGGVQDGTARELQLEPDGLLRLHSRRQGVRSHREPQVLEVPALSRSRGSVPAVH